MRKISLLTIIAALVIAVTSHAAGGLGKMIIVKVSGYDRAIAYKLLTKEELKELNAEIKAESSAWSKAMRNTQKEWKKAGNKARFPNCVTKRTARPTGRPYTDMQQAMNKMSQLDADTAADIKAEEKLLQEKKNKATQGTTGAAKIKAEKRFDEKVKRKQQQKAELEDARQVFIGQLNLLMPEQFRKEVEAPPAEEKEEKKGH